MALPNWISEIPGTVNHFVCDPDIFYPEWLAALGVEAPDQYWLGFSLTFSTNIPGCFVDRRCHARHRLLSPRRSPTEGGQKHSE